MTSPSDNLLERVARALVPVLCGSQEDEFGHDLPDKQFDDLPADWQERHLEYARVAIDAYVEASNDLVGEMEKALEKVTDSLEAELQARYPVEAEGHSPHPTMKRRYDRDMAEVTEARSLLSRIRDDRNGLSSHPDNIGDKSR